jgi:hypothetical protein
METIKLDTAFDCIRFHVAVTINGKDYRSLNGETVLEAVKDPSGKRSYQKPISMRQFCLLFMRNVSFEETIRYQRKVEWNKMMEDKYGRNWFSGCDKLYQDVAELTEKNVV